jgi:DNA-binding HxlR family transcriptional regulator
MRECPTGSHPVHDVYLADCPCRDLLDVIANKWSALIIGALEDGPLRFKDLKARLGGITAKVLTNSLRRLEEYELVHREVFAEVPPRVEYDLTPLGRSAIGPLFAVRDWAESALDQVPAST